MFFNKVGRRGRGRDVPGRLYLFLVFTLPAFQRSMEQPRMSDALRLKRSEGTGLNGFIVDSIRTALFTLVCDAAKRCFIVAVIPPDWQVAGGN